MRPSWLSPFVSWISRQRRYCGSRVCVDMVADASTLRGSAQGVLWWPETHRRDRDGASSGLSLTNPWIFENIRPRYGNVSSDGELAQGSWADCMGKGRTLSSASMPGATKRSDSGS